MSLCLIFKILQRFLLILSFTYTINSYKILLVSPVPGSSHGILGDEIVRHLTNAGHEVTYITAMSSNKHFPNVTTVDVSANKVLENNLDELIDLNNLLHRERSIFEMLDGFRYMMNVSVMTVNNPNVQQLIHDNKQKFDLIIAEWMGSEVYAGFSAVYDCPFVWFSSVEPHWVILRLIDELPNPSYHGDVQSNNIPPFSFIERVVELGLQIIGYIFKTIIMGGIDPDNYYKLIAPAVIKRGRIVPSFEQVQFNASLVLGNSHVSLGVPVRVPESYKHIAGYHIQETIKPLPEDLKKLAESSKHGVIYFSMGTNVKSKTLPAELKQNLLKMFGSLKQTVLWKFEEDLPNLPKNVHILKWAPQQSLLAHPNVILFITHGGLLSITEAIHFGVTIIAIPVFGDQFANVERAVSKGFAKRVDLSFSLADSLETAIHEVLSDARYKAKVKELSVIYHDRPVSPGKELVHWVEHVIKTNGARHMRSPALMMPWYQKCYLDLLFVNILLVYSFKYLLLKLYVKFNIPNKKQKFS